MAKKKETKKETAPVKAEPVVKQPPAKEVVEEEKVTSESIVNTIQSMFDEYRKTVETNRKQETELTLKIKSNIKNVHKYIAKEKKELSKLTKKSKRKDDPDKKKREPSGFAKESDMTPDLCKFLGVPNNTKMARTTVTKKICNYFKEKNLQNPANKREIKPDDKITKLLKLKKDDLLTYFNLQKYIAPHFIKATA